MAFRQVARPTATCHPVLPCGMSASPIKEGDAATIACFLLRIGHDLRGRAEEGHYAALDYVTRLFNYHRAEPGFETALDASTLVRETPTGRTAGVCLVGGGGEDGEQFGIYDIQVDPEVRARGIGTAMIERALTVLAAAGIRQLHLWRNDDTRAAGLYERLDFVPTGETEP